MNKNIAFVLVAILLGSFLSFGIDFYLPAIPQLIDFFKASDYFAQLTISLFLITFSVTQLLYGYLSDNLGRKITLLIGLSLFLIGSLACAVAPSQEFILIGRIIEGIGACSAIVTAYAVIRDHFIGVNLTRALSLYFIGTAFIPILLSVSSGFITYYYGWRTIFWFASIATAIVIILVFYIPIEVKTAHKKLLVKNFLIQYWAILKNRTYLPYSICGSTIFMVLLAFLGQTPIILTQYFHLKESYIGIIIGVNSFFIIIGNIVVTKICNHFSINQLIITGSALMILFGVILAIFIHIGLNVALYIILLYLITFSTTLILPTSESGILAPFENNPASANALAGFMRFSLASISTFTLSYNTSVFLNLSMLVIISGFVNIILISTLPKLRNQP